MKALVQLAAVAGLVALTSGAAHAAPRLDRSPPTAPAIVGPRMTSSLRPVYRFVASDRRTPRSRLRYRCSFDNRRLHGCGARYSQRLAVGRHVLRAQTVDRAGNRSGVRSVTVVVGSSQGSRLPSLHALKVVKQWYVDAAAGNDAKGNGSSTRPWRTVQRAADYLRSTAAWPSSGDVAVNLRPTGTYKSTTDPSATLSLDFTSAARAPRANRWLIWRRDPAYNGRAVIANPDGSDADKYGVVVSNTPHDNYMVFDRIRFTGESVPKGLAGSNGASTGVYLEGNNNHHFEFRNFEFDGFRQRNAANYESVEGLYQSGTTGPLSFVNGVIHDIATPRSGGAGGHGLYLHGESGILLLNVLAYKMNHGFAFQFYNSAGGDPGNGAIISHCTIVDNGFGANGGTIILPEAASNVKIVNSILAYNGSAAAIHFDPIGSPGSGNNGDHLLFYSNSGGNHDNSSGWKWTNERTANPHVLHGGKRKFRLRQGSPAIGYSNTAYSPAKDLNGNPRPPGAEDAGAFQFVPREILVPDNQEKRPGSNRRTSATGPRPRGAAVGRRVRPAKGARAGTKEF